MRPCARGAGRGGSNVFIRSVSAPDFAAPCKSRVPQEEAQGICCSGVQDSARPPSPPAVLQARPCSSASSAVSRVPVQRQMARGRPHDPGRHQEKLAHKACGGPASGRGPARAAWSRAHPGPQPGPTCHLCQRAVDQRLRARHLSKADAPHALVVCGPGSGQARRGGSGAPVRRQLAPALRALSVKELGCDLETHLMCRCRRHPRTPGCGPGRAAPWRAGWEPYAPAWLAGLRGVDSTCNQACHKMQDSGCARIVARCRLTQARWGQGKQWAM